MVSLAPVRAQHVDFSSSHLPILVIDTRNQPIPDEPKVLVRLGVIDNGPGETNHPGDPYNGYDGWIGIEERGSSSRMFPKKSYAVETREADGSNRNVSLLGMPEENDWVLYAPYSDKSLLRNVLIFHLGRAMGRYASRTRFCELILDGEYRGVYVLMEKIKWDDNRVTIARLNPDERSGVELTGGYMLKIDKQAGGEVEGWISPYPPPARPDVSIFYQYHYPRPSEIVEAQEAYIQAYMRAFEDRMQRPDFDDPVTGFPALLDVDSFVDYFILQELGRNVDGYRLSAFFYKDRDDRDGRLVMGPLWDFNLAFGNADYYGGADISGFQVDFAVQSDGFHVPFWWKKLAVNTAFRDRVQVRWEHLRKGMLHEDSLDAFIDSKVDELGSAIDRNFTRWDILGRYVWPNAFVGSTYEAEVAYLKRWIDDRLAWLDEHIAFGEGASVPFVPSSGYVLSAAYPNPFTERFSFSLTLLHEQYVHLALYDVSGRQVTLANQGVLVPFTRHDFEVPGGHLAAGVYYLRAAGEKFSAGQTLVRMPR